VAHRQLGTFSYLDCITIMPACIIRLFDGQANYLTNHKVQPTTTTSIPQHVKFLNYTSQIFQKPTERIRVPKTAVQNTF
jgi:hypothetical protein